MKIGLAYDLKDTVTTASCSSDDALEEYDSPETVDAIAAEIESLGHSVVKLGGGKEFISNILQNHVDFVFNIAEGLGNYKSREAQVPAILEMLGIPYSGSDPQCLALCLDKPMTKKLALAEGIRTPRCHLITHEDQLTEIASQAVPLPSFVKPAYEGSSKGIRLGSRVETVEQAYQTVSELMLQYRQPVMIEEFITDDEITVGILGNNRPQILGIMRVLPKQKSTGFIYSLEIKRDWERLVEYECPACLETTLLQDITEMSLKVFRVMGCRDFARIDFKVHCDGLPYFLEVNPLAGLNPKSSDLPIMAYNLSLTYHSLIESILNHALQRYPQCVRR